MGLKINYPNNKSIIKSIDITHIEFGENNALKKINGIVATEDETEPFMFYHDLISIKGDAFDNLTERQIKELKIYINSLCKTALCIRSPLEALLASPKVTALLSTIAGLLFVIAVMK